MKNEKKESIKTIICESCGEAFGIRTSLVLDTSKEKDALEQARFTNLFKVKCPECGYINIHYHSVFYIDRVNDFVIKFVPSYENLYEDLCELDEEFRKYEDIKIKRVVYGNLRSFIEKIEVLTMGLNDKVVELYKTFFKYGLEITDEKDIVWEYSTDFSEKRIAVYYEDESKNPSYCDIDMTIYNSIEKESKNMPFYNRNNDYIVNKEFGMDMSVESADYTPIHLKIIKKTEDEEAEKANALGVKLANEEKYDEALEVLLPFAMKGYKKIQNDLGVIYMRKGEYEEAEKWYKVSLTETARENLLVLYDYKRVEFTLEDYLEQCNILIQNRNQAGYLYKSYIHQIDFKGVEDHKKAFEVLLEGLIFCEKHDSLVFELGYLLEKGIGCDADQYKSHKCYEAILHLGNKVVNYNYALQCYQGRGCKQDIKKAIKYFEVSAEQNYHYAIEKLVEIYSLDDYRNKEKLKYYQSKLGGN